MSVDNNGNVHRWIEFALGVDCWWFRTFGVSENFTSSQP